MSNEISRKTSFGFTESEYENILPFFQSKQVKKNDCFLKEGQYVREMGFVESGILREHLYVDGKEVTKWFSTKGYFALDLADSK